MWTDDYRRIPVITLRFVLDTLYGLDVHIFAGSFVESDKAAILTLGVDCVRIFGINHRAEAVTSVGGEPVRIHYSRIVPCSCWSAQRVVVLESSIDEIERHLIISGHIVELCDRQIRLEVPIGPSVERLINTTITTN